MELPEPVPLVNERKALVRYSKIVVAAACLIGVSMTSSGAVARREFPSKITGVDEATSGSAVTQITGRVTSRKAECLPNRTLRAVVEGANIFFGSTTSDSDGFFAINGSGPRDVDYRITLSRSRPAGFRCGGDRVVVNLG